jgi:hypothetical protein
MECGIELRVRMIKLSLVLIGSNPIRPTKIKVMDRKAVKSSNMKSIGYDSKKMLLEVEFNNGGIYQYHPVTEEAYIEMQNADSVGKWFWANVKNNKSIKFKEM